MVEGLNHGAVIPSVQACTTSIVRVLVIPGLDETWWRSEHFTLSTSATGYNSELCTDRPFGHTDAVLRLRGQQSDIQLRYSHEVWRAAFVRSDVAKVRSESCTSRINVYHYLTALLAVGSLEGDSSTTSSTSKPPTSRLMTIFTPSATCTDIVTYDGEYFWQGELFEQGDVYCYVPSFIQRCSQQILQSRYLSTRMV